MKRSSKILLLLSVSFMCASSMAIDTTSVTSAPSSLVPVPILEDYPARISFGVTSNFQFDPKFRLSEFGGNLGVAYSFGGGFEGGLQLQGGANDDYLFSGSTPVWNIGGTAMLRFLGSVSDIFYVGLQGAYTYDYWFVDNSTFQRNSRMRLSIGMPFGITMCEAGSVYLMPAIELGDKKVGEIDQVWGTDVGGSLAAGLYIDVGGPKVMFEVKPHLLFSDAARSVGMSAQAGIAFEM